MVRNENEMETGKMDNFYMNQKTSIIEQLHLSPEILQKYSINTLLQCGEMLNKCGETMSSSSISDLLGLNSPRGLLNFGSSSVDGILCTPPPSPHGKQIDFDDARFNVGSLNSSNNDDINNNSYNNLVISPLKNTQRNSNASLSSSSTGSNTGSTLTTYLSRPLRSTSLSDSYGSTSPSTAINQSLLSRGNNSRSNSPDLNFIASVNSPELNDLLNSLGLNENIPQNNNNNNNNIINPNFLNTDLDQLTNLQTVQAIRYLQQQQSLAAATAAAAAAAAAAATSPSLNPLNPFLLPSAYNNTPNFRLLDKWNCGNNFPIFNSLPDNLIHFDTAARLQRSTASFCDAVCTWSGILPPRSEKPSSYSCKVFLGGVPWDISEQGLVQAFKQFGTVKVEWPKKDRQASQPKGYVYIIFESESSVKSLIEACTNNTNTDNLYFKLSSKRMKSKEVQVIPWFLSDSNYTKSSSQKLDPSKTVFVGALHGMLNAEGLALIMNDLYDGVVYAGIDTDKYKYPIGSGRVTFNNPRSYMKAVSTGFIEIKTIKFNKKVQVNPYLEDSLCTFCGVQQGPYFCRELICFRYFCRSCWMCQHGSDDMRHHKPMSRTSKTAQVHGLGSTPSSPASNSGPN